MSKSSFLEPRSEQDLEALIQRIHEYARKKEFGSALALCQHLILCNKTKRAGYRERAEVWQSMKETELAISDLKELVALETPEPVDYYNLGIVLLKQTEAKKAADAFSRALDLGTQHDFHYYTQSCRFHRAVCFLKLGMADKALEDCQSIEDGYSCHIPSQGMITKEEIIRQASAR